VNEITVRSALHHHGAGTPCNWDVNVYRGCGHGCTYCFARYSHGYLGSERFFDEIFVKTNVAERLAVQLAARRWRGEAVNLGGVTDSYQPVEADYGLMRKVLPLMIRHRNPVNVTTKSARILRDLDLYRDLAAVAPVRVAVSVTTADEGLRAALEPGASPTVERFRALARLAEVGCSTTVLLVPVLPGLTDDESNLDRLFGMAADAGAQGLLCWTLHLGGATKQAFMSFLGQYRPALQGRYRRLYAGGRQADRDYRRRIHDIEARLRARWGLAAPQAVGGTAGGGQLTLPF